MTIFAASAAGAGTPSCCGLGMASGAGVESSGF
jgi:hypothetical protein